MRKITKNTCQCTTHIYKSLNVHALRRVHICMRMRTRHVGPRRMGTNAKKLLVQRSLRQRKSERFDGHICWLPE